MAQAIAEKSVLVRHRLAQDIVEATEYLPKHSSKTNEFGQRQSAVQNSGLVSALTVVRRQLLQKEFLTVAFNA